jgi:hypothetical protein
MIVPNHAAPASNHAVVRSRAPTQTCTTATCARTSRRPGPATRTVVRTIARKAIGAHGVSAARVATEACRPGHVLTARHHAAARLAQSLRQLGRATRTVARLSARKGSGTHGTDAH